MWRLGIQFVLVFNCATLQAQVTVFEGAWQPHTMKISTSSEEAQTLFNQGLAFLYGFQIMMRPYGCLTELPFWTLTAQRFLGNRFSARTAHQFTDERRNSCQSCMGGSCECESIIRERIFR